MPAVKLPRAIQQKLGEVAAEVRRLRVLRGVCWLALVLLAAPLLAVTLDAAFDLSSLARGLMLAGWVTVGLLALWRLVLRPMKAEVPPAVLAAVIEKQYPLLAERLRTLVSLSEGADAGNGSKGMMALLAKETEKKAKRLDFFRAAPRGYTWRLTAASVLAACLAVAPAFFVAGSGDRVRRLVLPWYTPPVDVPFELVVSSGDPVVKRGEAVTLAAYLKRTKPSGDLPEAAVLAVRANGAEKRLPMTGDDKAAFTVTRPGVAADFEYRVECGPATSEWHSVSAVDPVEVADGSGIVVTPPEYAKALPVQKKDVLGEIEALQFSEAKFAVRFSRPPQDVHLEWRDAGAKPDAPPSMLPIFVGPDRTSAEATVPLTSDGSVRLVLFGDKKVRTEVPMAVKAVPDTPPRFEKALGVPDVAARDVRPDEEFTFDLAVTDDVAVKELFVEWGKANADDRFDNREPLPLPGVGTGRAEGKVRFKLAGKVAVGEVVKVRLRARDNRQAGELGPQDATFPEKGWAVLRVTADAKPLDEQDILAQKKRVREKLDEATAAATAAARDTGEVAREAGGKPALRHEHSVQLDQGREKAKAAARALEELARDAGMAPELQPLARAAQDVADRELRAADEQLRKAANEPDPAARDRALADAKKSLDDAVARLGELKKQNDATAKNRLDRADLDRLAEEQRKLADEAAKAKPEDADELAKKQQELADKLAKLRNESDELKKAAAEDDRKRANELADRATDLARQQRELDESVRKSADTAQKEQTEDLAAKQKQLNERAKALADKTDAPARLADTGRLPNQPFDKAADAITAEKPVDAMTEQEKAARELDRLADALSKTAQDRGDTKKAAEQIARWQEDLRRRAADAAKQNPGGIPKDQQDKLTAEQKAIQKAIDRLKLPPSAPLDAARADASEKAGKAADELAKKPGGSDAAMKDAADALDKLAKQTPSNEERRKAAADELQKLQREQNDLARDAEDAARTAAKTPDDKAARDELSKKLADTARKQGEVARKVKELDTPGHEARRDRAADAGGRAADDITAGLPQDIPASQQETKRQMGRLKEALEGQTPADEKAAELARQQNQLTKELSQSAKPDDVQRLQRQQADVAKRLNQLAAPEAEGQLQAARDAARAADDAMKKANPDADELKKKSQAAADATQQLADRMAGGESDERRAERLAKNRREQADKAKESADKPSDLTRSHDARRKAEGDQVELGQTRTGEAQAAKKKLADALDELKKAAEPDKAKDLQDKAATAARELADAMKMNGDRSKGDQRAEGTKADPADPADPGNALPSDRDAAEAKKLAQDVRDLRDSVARSMSKDKPQPVPKGGDPLGDLAKEQGDVAKKADELAKKMGDGEKPSDAGKKAADAADAAKKAADKLSAGDPSAAKQAAKDAAEKLKEAAKAAGGDPDAKAQAGKLADKQDELAKKAADAEADPSAKAGRQAKRQEELGKEAGDLAKQMEQAGKDRDGQPGSGQPSGSGKPLKDAADAAKDAAQKMDQADRDGRNGKPGDAAAGRKQSAEKLDRAAEAARPKADGGEPGDPHAGAADRAAKQAQDDMKDAKGQLGKGDGKQAGQAMDKAADGLKQAADQLAKAGQGDGQGDGQGEGKGKGDGQGQGSGGNTPGKGAGGVSGDVPSVVADNLGKAWGDLPGDTKQKITQELKAKYGEDYARIIKLYFEQLADKK